MLSILKKLFGTGTKKDIATLIREGAQIIDVRSRAEYQAGHLKGSLNVPLDQLHGQLQKIKNKQHPVITCCASGMRSSAAKNYLKSQGFTNVHNGGSWRSLKTHIK